MTDNHIVIDDMTANDQLVEISIVNRSPQSMMIKLYQHDGDGFSVIEFNISNSMKDRLITMLQGDDKI